MSVLLPDKSLTTFETAVQEGFFWNGIIVINGVINYVLTEIKCKQSDSRHTSLHYSYVTKRN